MTARFLTNFNVFLLLNLRVMCRWLCCVVFSLFFPFLTLYLCC